LIFTVRCAILPDSADRGFESSSVLFVNEPFWAVSSTNQECLVAGLWQPKFIIYYRAFAFFLGWEYCPVVPKADSERSL